MQTPDASYLDPALFSDAAVDAETAAFNAQLEALLASLPPTNTLPPQLLREVRASGKGPFGPIVTSPNGTDRTIRGPAGQIPLRVFVPPTVRGVYLHLHGGGWTLERPHHFDLLNEMLSQACEVAVVSVDYRLAPENPYPAGHDDCEAAALWLIENAKKEFGTEKLLIGGESAGAHLSAATLLRLRDRHKLSSFAGANLIYGAYDLTMTPSVRLWGERNLILSTPIIHWFLNHFVPAERRAEPDVSPLQAQLRGLPPALFTVGTYDPLLDDTLFMHSRWVAAGNRGELAIYPGAIHGFNMFPIAVAARANARMHAFLRGLL